MSKNVELHYPEMWGETDSEITAEFCLGKYRVTSKKEIPVSRGIEFCGLVGLIGSNSVPNKRAGWHKYYMTPNAFEKFSSTNKVVLNALLD